MSGCQAGGRIRPAARGRTARVRAHLLVIATLVACKSGEPSSGQGGKPVEGNAPPAVAAVEPPTLRLPDLAAPRAYRVALEVDPAQTTFRGRAELDLSVKRTTDTIWLNAQDLTIQRAVLRRGGADTPLEATVLPRNFMSLRAPAPIPAGDATIVVEYTGKQEEGFSHGLRRRRDRDDWYVVTQFEALGARRAFPSFDEPGWKVPFTIELVVPAELAAFSNAPVEREEATADGKKRVVFAPTAALPTYLIALAVGPFETVDAGTSRSGVPMRIIVPRGKTAEADYAAREVGKVLAVLEDYTGIPYPYAKLDHIAVPGSSGGAMEHPGLITYGHRFLVIPKHESELMRRAHVGIVAHELGHQWFGNLVTHAWWDDIWLNESFATWVEPWTIDAVHPEMRGERDHANDRASALAADELSTARRIRQPITDEAAIENAFDRITYAKGASVLRMFERWLGREAFQKGIRAYLERHAGGNATAADFLRAMDEATGKPFAAAMSTFLDQAGVPELSMSLACEPGETAYLALSQRRQVPLGAAPAEGDPLWQIPVCVAVPGTNGREDRCTLLTTKKTRLPLGDTCPAWIVPNVDAAGYYRARLDSTLLAGVRGPAWEQMTRLERMAVVDDLYSGAVDGEVPVETMFELLPRLAGSDDSQLVSYAADWLYTIAPLVTDAQRPAFEKLVRDTFGHVRKVGWLPRKGESVDQASMRYYLPLLGMEGADPHVRKEAVKLARAWLRDHTKVPPTQWASVLEVAITAEPKAMFDALVAALETERDLSAQKAIYTALAHVPDPELHERALSLLLATDTITSERLALLWGRNRPADQIARFELVKQNFDALQGKLSRDFLPSLGVTVCDAGRRDEVVEFLRGKIAPLPKVGEIGIAQKIERIDQCIAQRAALAAPIAAYLSAK